MTTLDTATVAGWRDAIGREERRRQVLEVESLRRFAASRRCSRAAGSVPCAPAPTCSLARRSKTSSPRRSRRRGGFRGIRQVSACDAAIPLFAGQPPALLADAAFRRGLARLAALGLCFDAWLLEPQLPDLVALARAVPEVPIVLDHLGTPLGMGAYAGRRAELFDRWQTRMRQLAECPNVVVKLGGLGMPICGLPSFRQRPVASSRQLADEWRPYVETAIEAFGVDRCMFESNYPTDGGSAGYRTIWNAFKRIAGSASAAEKHALFCGTAARTYRIDIPEVSIRP